MGYKYSKFNTTVNLNSQDNEYLLYNYSSNGLININGEYKAKINDKNNIEDNFTVDEIDLLKSNGFIIDSSINEINRLVLEHNKKYMFNEVLKLTILPTLSCNFNCHYCFERENGDNIFMTDEIIYKTIEFIKSRFTANKYLRKIDIDLYGGEPLVGMKQLIFFYDKLNELQKEFDFSYSSMIITNGYLLTDENISHLDSFNCHRAMISIDGYMEKHSSSRTHKSPVITDTYTPIINNAKRFIELGNSMTLRVHINDKSTFDDVKRILSEFPTSLRKRITPIFVPIFDAGVEVNPDIYLDQLRNYAIDEGFDIGGELALIFKSVSSCNTCASYDSYTISADGRIFICDYSDFSDEDFIKYGVGTIDKYEEIFSNTNYINFAGDFFYQKINCLKCKFLPACKGGCKVKSYQATNATGEEPCPIHLSRLATEEELINDLYLNEIS